MTNRLLSPESKHELKSLQDKGKEKQGHDILKKALDKIDKETDQAKISTVMTETLGELSALYQGSSAYHHDYSRWFHVVTGACGKRLGELNENK